MAGQGDVIGSAEDGPLVAERAEAFARELIATSVLGQILAHRAALLSVRMEKLAAHELVAGVIATEEAREQFDRDRAAEVAAWVAALDEGDATPARACLEAAPDGVACLIAGWNEVREQCRSSQHEIAAAGAARARRWFGFTGRRCRSRV